MEEILINSVLICDLKTKSDLWKEELKSTSQYHKMLVLFTLNELFQTQQGTFFTQVLSLGILVWLRWTLRSSGLRFHRLNWSCQWWSGDTFQLTHGVADRIYCLKNDCHRPPSSSLPLGLSVPFHVSLATPHPAFFRAGEWGHPM